MAKQPTSAPNNNPPRPQAPPSPNQGGNNGDKGQSNGNPVRGNDGIPKK